EDVEPARLVEERPAQTGAPRALAVEIVARAALAEEADQLAEVALLGAAERARHLLGGLGRGLEERLRRAHPVVGLGQPARDGVRAPLHLGGEAAHLADQARSAAQAELAEE